jgi:hypothetical protein
MLTETVIDERPETPDPNAALLKRNRLGVA